MTNYRNSGEGNTLAATVTAGGSTSDGQTAWDAVSVVASGTLIYDNAQVLNGSLAYKVATGATSGLAYVSWTTGITYAKPFFASMCCYFTANPSATFRLMSILTGSTVQGQLSLGTGGKFQSFDNAAAGGGIAFTNAIPLNAWFRVEFEIKTFSLTAAVYEIRLFLDPYSSTPTETQTSSAASLTTGSTATPTEIRFGHAGTNTASQAAFWMDELQANTVAYPPSPTRPVSATDPEGLTDSAAATVTGGPTDDAGLTDSVTVTLTTAVTDAAGATDTASAAVTGTATDALGVTDTAVASATVTKTDLAGVTDTAAGTAVVTNTDLAGITDSASVAVTATKTDPAGATDSTAATVTASRSDLAGTVDSAAVSATTTRTDPAGLTDATSGTATVTAVDSAGLTDAATATFISGSVPVPYESHGLTFAVLASSGITGAPVAVTGVTKVTAVTDGTSDAALNDPGTVGVLLIADGTTVVSVDRDATTTAPTISDGTGKAVVL